MTWVVHKTRHFWLSSQKITKYIEEMEALGWKLMFIDNRTYYWKREQPSQAAEK